MQADVQATAQRAVDAVTTLGAIEATSELAALAQRWTLELIGQALAEPRGPSWGDIGRVLSGLSRDGAVVSASVSRQAARQRFAQFAVVEHHRLLGTVALLERKAGGLRSRVKVIAADKNRNKAERKRDKAQVRAELVEVTKLLNQARSDLEAAEKRIQHR